MRGNLREYVPIAHTRIVLLFYIETGERRRQPDSHVQPVVAPPTSPAVTPPTSPATSYIYSRSVDLLTPNTPLDSSSSFGHESDDVFGRTQSGGTGSSFHSLGDAGTGGRVSGEDGDNFSIVGSSNSTEFEQAGSGDRQHLLPSCAQERPPAVTRGSAERSTSTDRLLPGDEDDATPGGSFERSECTATACADQAKSEPAVALASEQQLDLISPQAQRIADEILKEAQSSHTSMTCSTKSLSTATLEGEQLSHVSSTPSRSMAHTANKALQTSSQSMDGVGDSAPITSTQAGSNLPGPVARTTAKEEESKGHLSSMTHPGSSDSADHHTDRKLLDERSSSIFIDLQSRLQAQEYNDDSD